MHAPARQRRERNEKSGKPKATKNFAGAKPKKRGPAVDEAEAWDLE